MMNEQKRHKKNREWYNGKEQVCYEIKKVFAGTRGRSALALLALLMGVTLWFALGVEYVNEDGEIGRAHV